MPRRKNFARHALCVLAVLCGPIVAAPSDEALPEVQGAAPVDASGEAATQRAVPHGVNSGSRTVDLLIELQGKQAGLGLTVPERSVARTESPAPRTGLVAGNLENSPAVNSRPGLFDAAATPGAPPRDAPATAARANDWRAGSPEQGSGGTSPAPAPRAPGAGLTHSDGGVSLLRTVVAWLREHRNWVIGLSVAVLVGVGAASRRTSQRRR